MEEMTCRNPYKHQQNLQEYGLTVLTKTFSAANVLSSPHRAAKHPDPDPPQDDHESRRIYDLHYNNLGITRKRRSVPQRKEGIGYTEFATLEITS
jgi:hypothetical protein